jgi:toxin-antitoxin system PIN domain toxin
LTVLLDANLLLFAVDSESPHHAAAARWLTEALNGDRRVALPWQTIGAFIRISTHPRISRQPLTPQQAWSYVAAWLDAPATWVPPTSERTAALLGELVTTHHVTGNLVTDAQLAALALEIGAVVQSADADFARFPAVQWRNPLI